MLSTCQSLELDCWKNHYVIEGAPFSHVFLTVYGSLSVIDFVRNIMFSCSNYCLFRRNRRQFEALYWLRRIIPDVGDAPILPQWRWNWAKVLWTVLDTKSVGELMRRTWCVQV